jgi:hypothetical protein
MFTADGRASAAVVYPLIVNGQHEHSFDPLANDRDWAGDRVGHPELA